MVHEIFFSYVFFSYFIYFFLIYFFITSFKALYRSEHKNVHQGVFKNKAFLKISKIRLIIWQMLVKSKKKIFLMCFDPICTFMASFLEDSLSVLVHFFRNNCIIFMKKSISITVVAMHHASYDKKNFFKNLNLIDSCHHCKNWVDWINVGNES